MDPRSVEHLLSPDTESEEEAQDAAASKAAWLGRFFSVALRFESEALSHFCRLHDESHSQTE